MKTIQVKAVKRENYGKKAAKAVRREGQIPAVLYGGGETVSFSVDPREIKPLIYTPNSYIVDLEIDGKTEKAVLRDVQFHPIREEILHMDFYRVQPGKPVAISIPVRLTGNAEGVKIGGKLVLSARKLTVSAQLDKLPDELVIDVTPLGVGKTIFVGDLNFDGVKFLTPATTAFCTPRCRTASPMCLPRWPRRHWCWWMPPTRLAKSRAWNRTSSKSATTPPPDWLRPDAHVSPMWVAWSR